MVLGAQGWASCWVAAALQEPQLTEASVRSVSHTDLSLFWAFRANGLLARLPGLRAGSSGSGRSQCGTCSGQTWVCEVRGVSLFEEGRPSSAS